MFVKSYLELGQPIEQVCACLLGERPESWIPGIVEAEARWQGELLAQVGIDLGGRRLGQVGSVSVGEIADVGGGLMIPITWRSVGIDGLFPVVEADLQVAPMGPELTQLSINARYTPPLGPIGTIVDRALMHRLAEAVIRDFLHPGRKAHHRG